MTVRRHRRYSTDFKIQLVQAYLDGEGSVRKIATRHGVPHSLLVIWIRKYEAGELTEEIHLQEQVSEYEARIGAAGYRGRRSPGRKSRLSLSKLGRSCGFSTT